MRILRHLANKRILVLLMVAGIVSGTFLASDGTRQAEATTSWQLGDIFLGVANGTYQVRNSAGAFKENLVTGFGGFTTGCTFDSSGNFYGTGFSANRVHKFLGPGSPHTQSLFGGGYSTPESVVIDAAGNVFVGSLGNGIRMFDSTGAFIKTVINTRVDFFDIAADQDTIYYGQEGNSIKAVSITTGPLANFTTGTATQAFAMRILPDGGLLLADLGNVKRYNSAGVVTQTYDFGSENSWFSLNLDPNGTSFWAGNFNTSNYYKFNIASGALEVGPLSTGTSSGTLFGLCLFGEQTAAQILDLAPIQATNPLGTNHTLTATVDPPTAGILINFEVIAGPNTSDSGSDTTDASGEATFTYTGDGGAGTDTITASFTDGGGTVISSNLAQKTWVAGADAAAPDCTLIGLVAGVLTVRLQDTGSGLDTINILVNQNASVVVGSFSSGDTTPVDVIATKINGSQSSSLQLEAFDVDGNRVECDPVMAELDRSPSSPRYSTYDAIPQADRYFTISNTGESIVTYALVNVNDRWFVMPTLLPFEVKTIDIGSALVAGEKNTVTVWGGGHGSQVMISDVMPSVTNTFVYPDDLLY